MAASSVSLPNLTHIFLVAKPNLEFEGRKWCIYCSRLTKLSPLETTTKGLLLALSEIQTLNNHLPWILFPDISGEYTLIKSVNQPKEKHIEDTEV